MTQSATIILLVGLLLFGVNIPLAFRLIPMNRWYGFRLRASFQSDQRWYDINAYGGRHMAGWSVLIIAAGISGFCLPEKYREIYSTTSTVVTLVACFVPVLLTLVWIRRHPG